MSSTTSSFIIDENYRRQHLLRLFALGVGFLIAFVNSFLVVVLVLGQFSRTTPMLLNTIVGWVVVIFAFLASRLAYHRRWQLLGHGLLVLLTVATVITALGSGVQGPTLDILFIVVVAATMAFSRRGSLIYGGLAGLAYASVAAYEMAGLSSMSRDDRPATVVFIVCLRIAMLVIVVFLTRLIEASLLGANEQARQQASALQRANQELAAQQDALTAARDQLAATVVVQQADLVAANEAQEELAAVVQAVSTPVVPIIEGVIVMVLVGEVNRDRATLFTTTLLQTIDRQHAQVALIDITGVEQMNSEVATALVQAATAARLMGAQVIIVGITPAVAETLVGLQIDFKGVSTASDLQGGVSQALKLRNLALVAV